MDIAAGEIIVHLQGIGSIRIFKFVSQGGDIGYWATDDLMLDDLTRLAPAEQCWTIKNYHRGLKQCCGVKRAQVRETRAQRNHIELAIRSFLGLDLHCHKIEVS